MNKEQTVEFIKVRRDHEHLFTGAKNSAALGWRAVIEKMGLQGKFTPLQAKKKWDNLKRKYKECKYPGSGDGVSGKPTAATWPWFALMDEVLGQRPSTSSPVPIATIQEDTPEPSSAVGNQVQDEESCSWFQQLSDRAGYKEQTAEFIKVRQDHEHLFTGAKNSAALGWRAVIEKMGLQGKFTPLQAKKKWDHLKRKYKECKYPGSGDGVSGKPTAATWPWFALMDEVLGQRPSTSSPVPIASIQEDTPEPSSAVGNQVQDEESCSWFQQLSDRAGYKEQTAEFIKVRQDHEHLFTGAKNSAALGWRAVIEKMGLQGKFTPLQAKKKWDHLKRKYKECKYPGSGDGVSGKPTAATWPWFALMDEVLGQSPSTSSPVPIASIQEDTPEPSSAVGNQVQDEEEQGQLEPRREKRKRDKDDELLDLIREDMRLRREMEERREERMDRLLDLIEKFTEK